MKTAVIMAAGLGTRFGHYTERLPKGFVEVGGQAMIRRSIHTLVNCGISRIIIGTGYKKEAYENLKSEFPLVETCFNPRYAETNSMYTLYQMQSQIGKDDFILLESDLIFNKHAIETLITYPYSNVLLATPITKFQDQYFVESDENGRLTNCSVNKADMNVKGEFVGIHKISNAFFQKMCNEYSLVVDTKLKLGYEYQLLYMSQHILPIYVFYSQEAKWYEIDDERDLKYAEKNIIPFL